MCREKVCHLCGLHCGIGEGVLYAIKLASHSPLLKAVWTLHKCFIDCEHPQPLPARDLAWIGMMRADSQIIMKVFPILRNTI